MKPKRVVVAPYSRLLKNGAPNPKNWPIWSDLLRAMRKQKTMYYFIQIGSPHEMSIGADEFCTDLSWPGLVELLQTADLFLSVDSFLPHAVNALREDIGKDIPGVVIWTITPPELFGYPQFSNVQVKDPTVAEFPLAPMEQIAEHTKEVRAPSVELVLSAIKKLKL